MTVRKIAAPTSVYKNGSEAVHPSPRGAWARHLAISKGVSRSILAAMIVMGAPMVTAAPAMAGTCTVTAPIICSGAASTTRTDPAITVNVQAPVAVELPSGFGYDNTGLATNTRGLTITGQGVTFTDQAHTQIRAGFEALKIQNNGGTANVTVNGRLESTGQRPNNRTYGFEFTTDAAAGDANISLNDVTGAYTAAWVAQTGPGDLNLTIGDARSTTNNAVRAAVTGAGDLNLDVTGTLRSDNGVGLNSSIIGTGNASMNISNITTGGSAILHTHNTTGATEINITDTITAGGDGIILLSDNTSGDLTIRINNMNVADRGLSGNYNGVGNYVVDVTGEINATNMVHLAATTSVRGRDLTVSMGSSTGAGLGVNFYNHGTGDSFFTSTGTITSTGGDGVTIFTDSSSNNLTARMNSVEARNSAVYVQLKGRGVADIAVTGLVSSAEGIGVYANGANYLSPTAATGLNLRVADVNAQARAVLIDYLGTGDVNFTSTGTVTSRGQYGFQVRTAAGTGNFDAQVNNVRGLHNAVDINYIGNGTLNFRASGTLESSDRAGAAIRTSLTDVQGQRVGPSAVNLDVQDVTGQNYGLIVEHNARGPAEIIARGTLTGRDIEGLVVDTGSEAGDIDVSLQAASGGVNGANFEHDGRGTANIVAAGALTGGTGDGLRFIAGANVGDASFDLNSASGGMHGAFIEHGGLGTVNVVAAGALTGTAGDGIRFASGPNVGNATFDLNSASGGAIGAHISYAGRGLVDVTTQGTVRGGSSDGLRVATGPTATGLNARVQDATGGANGVRLSHVGGGLLNVVIEGQATGTGGDGLNVVTVSASTGVQANVNQLTGRNHGAFVQHDGTGDLRLTATGAVVGQTQDGMNLRTVATGDNMVVAVQNVTGQRRGVIAAHRGTGSLTLDATGTLTGATDYGARLDTFRGANNLTARIDNAVGGNSGVFLDHAGRGVADLTVRGTATGTTRTGVTMTTGNASTGVAANVQNAAGQTYGVIITHGGAGETRLIGNGTITGTANDGVRLSNAVLGGDVVADVQTVTGGANGLFATQDGSGELRVTAQGPLTGTAADGLLLIAGAAATGVNAQVAQTTGGVNGAFVTHNGTGDLQFQSDALVTGTTGDGVRLVAGVTSANINAAVAGATGGRNGVWVQHAGSGDLTLTATGPLIGQSQNGAALVASADVASVTATIQAASGALSGVYVETAGTVPTDLTLNELVEGAVSGVSINAAGGPVRLLNNGTLRNRDGNSQSLAFSSEASGPSAAVTVDNRGDTIGAVRFGAGDDLFDNSGLWNGAGAVHDFGAGQDQFINNAAGRFIAAGHANLAEVTRLGNLDRMINRGAISLADGGADDVLIVSGDISFAAGSVLAVDISGADQSDLLSASGTVELNGVTLQVTDLGARPVLGRRYTIVEAGALNGEFSVSASHITNFLALSAFYTDKTAGLELVQRRRFEDAGLTDNQKEVGRELDRLPNGNDLKDNVLVLDNDDQARDAFDQLSGEAHAAARTLLAEDSRLPRNAILDRLSDGEGSRLWGKGLWNQGTSDGDRGTAKTKREAWGVLAGADIALGENLLLGISGAYLDNDVNQRSRSSEGSVKSIHVLGYVGAQAGALRVKAGVGYAWADVETVRNISFGGYQDRLTANYNANMLQAFGEVGLRLPLGTGFIEPMAQLVYLRAKTDGFSEAGGEAALTAHHAVEKSTLSTIGARFETSVSGPVSFGGMVGWQHGYGQLTPVSRMSLAGGQGFNVQGVPLSRDAGVVNVEARFRLSDKAMISLGYDGVIGTASQDHAALASFRLGF